MALGAVTMEAIAEASNVQMAMGAGMLAGFRSHTGATGYPEAVRLADDSGHGSMECGVIGP